MTDAPPAREISVCCHACGYLRVGLAHGTNCPECGTPPPPPIGEIETAAWHALPFSTRVRIMRALRAAEALLAIVCVGLLLTVLMPLFNSAPRLLSVSVPGLISVGVATALCAAGLLHVAVWSIADPAFGRETRTHSVIIRCRAMTILAMIMTLVTAARWIIAPMEQDALILGAVTLGVMLFEAAASISVLRPLARATTNRNLDQDLHAMRWFLLIAGVPCLCMMLPAYLGLWLACINTTRRALQRDMVADTAQ